MNRETHSDLFSSFDDIVTQLAKQANSTKHMENSLYSLKDEFEFAKAHRREQTQYLKDMASYLYSIKSSLEKIASHLSPSLPSQ